jgi:hypothetical protein
MRRMLLLVLIVGLSSSTAKPSDEQPFVPDAPLGKDFRLAPPAGVQPRKVGILTYYPNKAGGYTFVEHGKIVFYALPYLPNTREVERTLPPDFGTMMLYALPYISITPQVEVTVLPTIGTSKVPYQGQIIYRSQWNGFGIERRADIPIAKWARDTPDGPFRFTMRDEDRLSRLKLLSIVPLLQNSSKRLVSAP